MVLLVGAAGDRERAAVFERDGAATCRQPAVTGYDQALEPGLTGHAAQLLRRLLEAGGGVRLVRRDIDADRAGAVHPPKRDHPAALIHDDRRDRKVDALCLSVRSLYELHGLLDGDRHRRSRSSLERGLRTPMLRRFFS